MKPACISDKALCVSRGSVKEQEEGSREAAVRNKVE